MWDFVWHEFCDWYLEVKKLRFQEGSGLDHHWKAALTVYEMSLRLLHPFMPFITEELWQRLVQDTPDRPVSVSLAHYPQASAELTDGSAERAFGLLQEIVTGARELRADNKLDPKTTYPAVLRVQDAAIAERDLIIIATINPPELRITNEIPEPGGLLRSTPDFDLRIEAQTSSSNGASYADSRARLDKEAASFEKLIANSKRQLSDETFLSRAPEKVVEYTAGETGRLRGPACQRQSSTRHAGVVRPHTQMFDTSHPDVRAAVERALLEDIGRGDVTTNLTVPVNLQSSGSFVAKQDFILAGIELLPLIYEGLGGAKVELLRSRAAIPLLPVTSSPTVAGTCADSAELRAVVAQLCATA